MDGGEPRDGARETYDRIVSYFVSTHRCPWSEVESFIVDATESGPATRALDPNYGNGRHVGLLSEHADEVVGLDASRGLLDEVIAWAAGRGFDAGLVQGDVSRFPFTNDAFDLVIYMATVHHLAPRAARVISLNELAHMLGVDNRAIVSTWSTAHDTFDREDGFDTTVNWTLPSGETVPRFYHIYASGGFGDDPGANDLTVVELTVFNGNCYTAVTGC